MASIEGVPNDILLTIFRLYADTRPGVLPPPRDDPRRALTGVCSQWRRIVTSTPAFWQEIRLAPVCFEHPSHLLNLLYQYVRRSQNHPLTLHFDNSTSQAVIPHQIEHLIYGGGSFNIIESILLPCRAQLTSLTCLLCKEDILAFLKLPATTFPALQHVDITFIYELTVRQSPFTLEPHYSRPFTVFQHHPSLRQATFHIFNCLHPLGLNLPWNRLTKLDFASTAMPPDVFLDVMKYSAMSLLDASFKIKFIPQLTSQCLHVCMPHLTRLRLVLIDPSRSDRYFFHRLQLPVLEYLRIERLDAYYRWEMGMFAPMLVHASRSLQHLELANFAISGATPCRTRRTFYQELDVVFRIVHHLRVLRLPVDVPLHAITIEKLASGELLPLLRDLEVFSVRGEHILSMVERRNHKAQYQRLCQRPGTSRQGAQESRGPSLISHLFLFVYPEEKEALEKEAILLGPSPCSITIRAVG